MVIPDYYLKGSNILSSHEGLLIRWLELNYEKIYKIHKRFTNFDSDLKDGVVFSSIIKNYAGKFDPID